MNEFFFQKARLALVEQLKKKGIFQSEVLDAISKVPRHQFVESALAHRAYEDTALPIGQKQTISQPYTVAVMTQELGVSSGQKVLEIGTGSGYQAAILRQMGITVFTIERHEPLLEKAQQVLDSLGFRVAAKCGDGTLGWSQFAPYDGIICTAGGPIVPPNLLNQLKIGGKLVIPVGDDKTQSLHVITREGEEQFSKKEVDGFKFVPLIGKNGWNQ